MTVRSPLRWPAGTVFALLLGVAACADPYEPPTLEGIRYESGNEQTGIAGGPLAQQLVVKAFNQKDEPIAGARVQFSAPSGTFDQAVKFSDLEGLAKVTYTFGSTPGPVTITASTLAGEVTVRFSATAELGPPTSLRVISGNAQTGVAGTTLATPLRVRVTNQYGVGLSGEPVSWSASAGQVSEASSTTDATGYAQVTFTLGPTAGAQTVTATSGSLTAVTFSATATEPPPPPPPAEPLD